MDNYSSEVDKLLADCIKFDVEGNSYPDFDHAKAAINRLVLQARIDELKQLDSQRVEKETQSQLYGNVIKYYEVPINLIWNRIAELQAALTKAEEG